jgi:VIT1/CCC1 family predicted Fe2+/Mn2+ transporter
VALAVTGFFVSVIAYVPPGKKVAEMIVTGSVSAAITYGIGKIASDFLGTHV